MGETTITFGRLLLDSCGWFGLLALSDSGLRAETASIARTEPASCLSCFLSPLAELTSK